MQYHAHRGISVPAKKKNEIRQSETEKIMISAANN
jgi:hypothetical protein